MINDVLRHRSLFY